MAHAHAPAEESPAARKARRRGFRLDAETRSLVERAAALEHRNLTDFRLTALAEAARRTIEHHEVLTFSDRDRAPFFEALARPPAPNRALELAFEAGRTRLAP